MEVWSGYTLFSKNNSVPEKIAMAGVPVIKHTTVKAWEPSGVERLLPAKHKISEGELSSFYHRQSVIPKYRNNPKPWVKKCSLSTLMFKTT